MTVDQKGDNDQVKDLVKFFDFAVVEQCYAQGWCNQFDVYTNANRLVVDVEYYHNQQRFLHGNCSEAAKNHDTAMLKKLELTAWILTCKSNEQRGAYARPLAEAIPSDYGVREKIVPSFELPPP